VPPPSQLPLPRLGPVKNVCRVPPRWVFRWQNLILGPSVKTGHGRDPAGGTAAQLAEFPSAFTSCPLSLWGSEFRAVKCVPMSCERLQGKTWRLFDICSDSLDSKTSGWFFDTIQLSLMFSLFLISFLFSNTFDSSLSTWKVKPKREVP